MDAAPPPPILDVSTLTGPWALGFIFSSILYGILIVQVSIYLSHFPKDLAGIKALVWVVTALETIFTVICCIASWNSFGTNWGNINGILVFHWSWISMPPFNGLVSFIVQCFFAWRIHRLSKKLWLCLPIAMLAFAQCFAAFYYNLRNAVVNDATIAGLQMFTRFIDLWLIGSAVCDILITIAMVTILVMAASNSPIRQTNQLLTRIAKFTVETNLITTVAAVVELILYRIMPNNGFHFIFFFILGRLYSNVLMASLNSRMIFSNKHGGYSNVVESPTQSALWADMPSAASNTYIRKPPVTVNVSTTKVARGDHEMSVMTTSEDPASDSKPVGTLV